jgi:hypothetical protein
MSQKKVTLNPGYFNGDITSYIGFLQLNVREKSGMATFLNVITQHLPPYEFERIDTTIKADETGRLILNPWPETILPEIEYINSDTIIVTLKNHAEKVELKRETNTE